MYHECGLISFEGTIDLTLDKCYVPIHFFFEGMFQFIYQQNSRIEL